MKIAICDDQTDCNVKLRQMLKSYFEQKKIDDFDITEYTSGKDLADAYSGGMFDFIFLDVQMPGLNGDKTAEKIRSCDLSVDIVFVTNMRNQPLMGYNYNAKGFLFKEVTQEQIDQLMDRLLGEMRRREDMGTYPIKLRNEKSIMCLRLSDVLYFESRDKDIIAKTASEEFEFRGKLANVERELTEKGFLRINRSLLVNTSHVFKNFGDYVIIKNTGEKLFVGRNYKESVDRIFRLKV